MTQRKRRHRQPIPSLSLLMRGTLALSMAIASSAPLWSQAPPPLSVHRRDAQTRVLRLTFPAPTLEKVDEGGRTWTRIVAGKGVWTEQAGYAELPVLTATLLRQPGSEVEVKILRDRVEERKLANPLLPSRGLVYRSEDPSARPRMEAPEALKGGFFPEKLVHDLPPFTFRERTGFTLQLHPCQYDAATRTLRVHRELVVKVTERVTGPQAIRRPAPVMADTEPIFRSLFLDYGDVPLGEPQPMKDWKHEVGEVGDILAICTERDKPAMERYAAWKRAKGHRVDLRVVAPRTPLKPLLKKAYGENPRLLYAQLAGGWKELRSEKGTNEDAPMDPELGCLVGNDPYPELIVGRFCGSSAEDVAAQVDKAIAYERDAAAGETWCNRALIIASGEGAGNGDDGESDIEHEIHIKEGRLLPTTYKKVDEVLGDGAQKTALTSAMEEGLGLVNYTGHGQEDAWVTGWFTTRDAGRLSNAGRLPVVCSVACVVGAFHRGDCLAESLLRNPKGGAVAGLFSTISQPWKPPMRGQDYFNDLLTGGFHYGRFDDQGIDTEAGRSTFGSIVANAMVLMYTESQGLGDLETIQTWTTFGDASLQVRTDAPLSLAVEAEGLQAGQPLSVQVTSGGKPVEGALVALSRGEEMSSAFTDDKGRADLKDGLEPGPATLVVTGRNLASVVREVTVLAPEPVK